MSHLLPASPPHTYVHRDGATFLVSVASVAQSSRHPVDYDLLRLRSTSLRHRQSGLEPPHVVRRDNLGKLRVAAIASDMRDLYALLERKGYRVVMDEEARRLAFGW